jgi:hypothetical protein
MYTLVPHDIYHTIYGFLSPHDMSSVKCISKEQYRSATRFLENVYECILCHEWANPSDGYPDLDDYLHEDDINERNSYMSELSNIKRYTFLCESCLSITWTDFTISNFIQCIPSSIRIRYVYTSTPWAYLYFWKDRYMLWSPISINLI